jgi:hypothetical protein
VGRHVFTQHGTMARVVDIRRRVIYRCPPGYQHQTDDEFSALLSFTDRRGRLASDMVPLSSLTSVVGDLDTRVKSLS